MGRSLPREWYSTKGSDRVPFVPRSVTDDEMSDSDRMNLAFYEMGRFLISPFLLPINMMQGFGEMTYGDKSELSHLDRGEAARNAVAWGGIAGASWGYHALMHPGKYTGLRSATGLVKIGLANPAVASAATYAGAVGAGYVIGAVVGTAVSGAIWGEEGADMATGFYTGDADYGGYFDLAGNANAIWNHYFG